MASPISAVNIHLIGKQGSGKSASGNFILMNKAFRSKLSNESVTLQTQTEVIHVANRLLRIWDGPGVTENSRQTFDIAKKLRETIEERGSENHILLWVIRYGEPSGPDDEHLLKALNQTLGQTFVKENTFVLVTHKDNFDSDVEGSQLTFDDWMRRQTGFFLKLCRTCDGRVMPIDNKLKAEAQRQQLLDVLISLAPSSRRSNPYNKGALPSKSTTDIVPRQLPMPSKTKQPVDALSSDRQTKQKKDDHAVLKDHIDQLTTILSGGEHKVKLASLEKIRDGLKTCDVSEKRDLLLAVRREVDREIEMCRAAISTAHQTGLYLNQLSQSLHSGSIGLGPLGPL